MTGIPGNFEDFPFYFLSRSLVNLGLVSSYRMDIGYIALRCTSYAYRHGFTLLSH